MQLFIASPHNGVSGPVLRPSGLASRLVSAKDCGCYMRSVALRSTSVVLVATATVLMALTAQADIVSGNANGQVTIMGPNGPVAQVSGPYEINLPPGTYNAFCPTGPASPSSFESRSTPVTVDFSCP